MLKEILRSVCALALAASLTSDGNPLRQAGQLPGVETPVQYYPELQNVPLRGHGSFVTRGGTRFYWYNYIAQTFNPVAAREMFSYFQDLIPAKGLTIPMVYRGRAQQATLLPRQGIQQVALFITPENAPKPNTATINIPGRRVDLINRALAIEACQQFILIGRLIDSRPLNEQIGDQAQEELCHSLGIAYAMRQLNVPYAFYRQEVRRIRAGSDSEPIILEKRTYNGIPFTGPIV